MVRGRAEAREDHRRELDRQRVQSQREAAQETLERKQGARRTALSGTEQELLVRQAAEKLSLEAAQLEEGQGLLFRMRSAVAAFIDRTPALRSVLGSLQKKLHLDLRERHTLEAAALAARHHENNATAL